MAWPTLWMNYQCEAGTEAGNELSVPHWGANHYRLQRYLQGYYFLHRMNGNQCLRKLLQSLAGASRFQLGLM